MGPGEGRGVEGATTAPGFVSSFLPLHPQPSPCVGGWVPCLSISMWVPGGDGAQL